MILMKPYISRKKHANDVIDALEDGFEDNGIVSTFKIPNPCNMPSKLVNLIS